MAVDPDALRTVHFLPPLKQRARRQLAARMSERTAEKGEDVVTEGQSGIAFFVVLEGELSVLVGRREVHRLGAGDHFGEIALLAPDAERTATVRAVTPARLGALSRWNFKGFLSEHPETHWPLLVTLAHQAAGRSSKR